MTSIFYSVRVALIVALGGFLMGFDASVISGVVRFIEVEFVLSKIELGWSVASLSLSATLAMMLAGPISDRIGRKPVLTIAALLFLLSATLSATATSFIMLVVARMVGGLGVGAALIIAPMYIAEIAPSKRRGLMVSFNQLNIVVGISTAFFTNYLILKLGQSEAAWALQLKFADWGWRWMLGLEVLPALLYLLSLNFVPESPRWLIMQGRKDEALAIMTRACGATQAQADLDTILTSLAKQTDHSKVSIKELLKPSMRLVMVIGISVAVLQQITGINSVFFYAPMIFEQSGIGTDAAFMQAILVGLVNLLFTLVALALIDKIGRKPLLSFGVSGIAVCMFVLAFGFHSATYTLTPEAIESLPAAIDRSQIVALQAVTYDSDTSFRAALYMTLGEDSVKPYEAELVTAAISMNATLILAGILGFVACFAVSIGPVMWVLFSELFPNRVRGVAISFVGLINSAVSFTVQLIFPWELANFGNALTFLIYGVFALLGVAIIIKLLPETSGKSLEELEQTLVNTHQPLNSQA